MVIDSSVLVSILLDEPHSEDFLPIIATAKRNVISSIIYYESLILLLSRKGESGVQKLKRFISDSNIEIEPFEKSHAQLSYEAYKKYGKGFHKAALNFADCASYALAKYLNEPLLYKGEDFKKTDVEFA